MLFLDTCCLLDLMRTPVRPETDPNNFQAAMALLGRIEASAVVCFFAEQAETEFQDNKVAVADEAANGLVRQMDNIARIERILTILGRASTTNLSHLASYGQLAQAAVDRYRACFRVLSPPPDVAGRAWARVGQARTPSRKGKESMKDCVVIETYLEAIRYLRAAGATGSAVFASSNTADYRDAGGGLKPDLAAEFTQFGMDYAPNLGAANYQLV
jgi:hypothetical protein